MKHKIILFGFLALIIASCSTEADKETKKETKEEIIKEEIIYPYKFINSKSEAEGGDVNEMELFAYSGEINIDTLKMFCKERKKEFTSGAFYYIVIFDKKEKSVFPNNPMTAFYGMDKEPQKHIRAYYEYNRLNGYSKLNFYEKNSWESTSEQYDI